MIYEIRTYYPAPNKAAQLRARFETEVIPRLPKFGITLVAAFVPTEDDGRLIYMTKASSAEESKAAWAGFAADPDWLSVKAESESDGKLLEKQEVTSVRDAFTVLPGPQPLGLGARG